MINDEVLVSIITPAYNCSETIRETIESVLSQTWNNWEMIIVNDCSTDNTVDIVNEYVKKDSRIKLINFQKNSGSAAARNTAIRQSNGRYIALLDSDDLWKSEKLKKQVAFMQENNIAFSFTSYDVFKKISDRERRVFVAPKKITYNQYLKNSIIGCLTVMIDKEMVPDFHMEEGYLEDVLTWMYYLKKGIVAYGIDEILASYRVSENSKSGKKIKNAQRFYQCLKEQEGIGLIRRIYSQIGYMFHALKKRIFSKKIIIND